VLAPAYWHYAEALISNSVGVMYIILVADSARSCQYYVNHHLGVPAGDGTRMMYSGALLWLVVVCVRPVPADVLSLGELLHAAFSTLERR
jgi:hypothetical protein